MLEMEFPPNRTGPNKPRQTSPKATADIRRTAATFNIGDHGLLKLHPQRQLSLHNKAATRLSLRYYGPFKIIEKIGGTAYKLQLPSHSKIHPVFHISLLKPYYAGSTKPVLHLPPKIHNDNPIHEILSILDERKVWVKGKPKHQVLIQWADLPPADSSWEDATSLDNKVRNILKLRLPTDTTFM